MYSPLPQTLLLPRAFLEHPLPLSGQGSSVEIPRETSDGAQTIKIGQVDRWKREASTAPGLTLDRITILCALLLLRDRGPITYNSLFRLLTPSSGTCSAHHREKIKQLLAELEQVWCESSTQTGSPSFSPLVSFTPGAAKPVFGRPTPAFSPVFCNDFLNLLGDPSSTIPFRMDSLLSIRSRLARCLFCFLPTWAHYSRATAGKPFRISLSKLIAHLGLEVPRYASARKAFFYGHRQQGLFDELQGLPTPFGELCFAISPAVSLDDECILVWFNKTSKSTTPAYTPSSSQDPIARFRALKIFQAWKDSGGSDSEFLTKIQQPLSLSPHDQELLSSAGIHLAGTDRFLTLAKKVLPERTWLDLLGEAKYAAIAAPAAPRHPQAKLISEILSAIRSRV